MPECGGWEQRGGCGLQAGWSKIVHQDTARTRRDSCRCTTQAWRERDGGMKLRMFLKMSAMLGLMAAPVLKLFEKKREFVTKVKHDELVGLRVTITECNEYFGDWVISERFQDNWM